MKTSVEFVDVCQHYLGPPGKYVAFLFGIVAFLGAIVVYWVLMTNFLYKIGKFTYGTHVLLITIIKNFISVFGTVFV